MAAVSATKLRQNLYNILDSVVDTGVPVEIERNGRLLRIVAEEQGSKWDRLTAHQVVVGDRTTLCMSTGSMSGTARMYVDTHVVTMHTYYPAAVW